MDRDSSTARCSARSAASARAATVSSPRQRGAAIVETIIALPLLLCVILGAIQFGLIYQAKATLNHASLQAARAGAVGNASAASIRQGLARGLVPLYSPQSSLEGVATALAEVNADLATDARIRILNPTREAFADFAEEVDGQREIPNDRLHVRSTTAGHSSDLNIQDANVLKLQVTYGYELKVPLVNWFITRALSQVSRNADAFEQQLLRRNRLPILAGATVRMQSPARTSDLVVARADLPDIDRFDANSRPADKTDTGQHDSDAEDGTASQAGDRGGSTLGDGFFGFGGGQAQPIASSGEPGTPTPEPTQQPPSSNARPTPEPTQHEEPLCTPVKKDASNDADNDTGLLGEIWGELKSLAGTAVEFVKGFWEGIKGQLEDFVDMVTDLPSFAKGLYELAKSFRDDFGGTAQMIGEAIGKDLKTLVHCGAFDRGRVIGANIDPQFILKLATKLAKFGRLTRALEETRQAFGCASFVAGTPIWTAGGSSPVESIHVADQVISRDRASFDDGPHPVGKTFQRTAPGYYAVVTEEEVLHVTAEHPLWVQGRGWTEASELRAGDALATLDGDTLVRQTIPVDSPTEVFNFSVPETGSYFAGKRGVWVHNANCEIPPIYRAPDSPSDYLEGANDGGAGAWGSRTRVARTPAAEAAIRYQQQVTGAPRVGQTIKEYIVDGVDFDGYDAARDVLIEAKRFTEDCLLADCKPERLQDLLANKSLAQARRQLNALDRVGSQALIEWHVATKEMADKLRDIFSRDLGRSHVDRIKVIFTPDIVN